MINEMAAANIIIQRQLDFAEFNTDPTSLELYLKLDRYLEEYCTYAEISSECAAEMYFEFIRRYAQDLKRFSKEGCYPTQTERSATPISREEYDVFLIASCLLTPHRFRIMQLVHEQAKHVAGSGKQALVIGVGSGIELLLINGYFDSIMAYDLKVPHFARDRFKNVTFHEKHFAVREGQEFSAILMIELLEHLNQPVPLLRAAHKSLAVDGKILATTARNVPQFDHLFNFSDPDAFESAATKIGLEIDLKERIPHDYSLSKVDADNVFYVFRGT